MKHITIIDGGMGRELNRRGAPFRQPEWSALALTEALYVGICVQRSDASVQAVSKTMRATQHRKY